MKKSIYLLAGLAAAVAAHASTEPQYKLKTVIGGISPAIVWTETGSDCSEWLPATNTVEQGVVFEQTMTCEITEKNNVNESRTRTTETTQDNIGTSPVIWTAQGEPYNCTTPMPLESEVSKGVEFTQSSTCDVDYISNFGAAKTENEVIENNAVGTQAVTGCHYTPNKTYFLVHPGNGWDDVWFNGTRVIKEIGTQLYIAEDNNYIYTAGASMYNAGSYVYYELCFEEK